MRIGYTGLLAACLVLTGCAGFRGGWESVAYIGDAPPAALRVPATSDRQGIPPQLAVPGLRLHVAIDNQLRTHDTQVYFFVLPLSIDPRDAYPKNIAPGRTRVFVTVTPEAPGFVFRPSAAVLEVAGRRFIGETGFEFGMWDGQWTRVPQGGRWEHRPIDTDMPLSEIGRKYLLSIDFATPTPSPQSNGIVLDLSQALKSATQPPLPPIRFVPVRWKEGYT